MSEQISDAAQRTETDGDFETVDALPVLAPEASVIDGSAFSGELARSSGTIPAAAAAAVAAGGFVAGAAVVGLVTRHQRGVQARGQRPRLGRRRAPSRGGELVQIVGSRSLLLDVHLLGGRG